MKTASVAFVALLGVQCLLLVAFLAAWGAPPVSAMLVIAGFLIMAIGSHWALSSSRARRGKANPLFASFDDLLNLGSRGWLVTLASGAIGGGVALAGFLLASPGGSN